MCVSLARVSRQRLCGCSRGSNTRTRSWTCAPRQTCGQTFYESGTRLRVWVTRTHAWTRCNDLRRASPRKNVVRRVRAQSVVRVAKADNARARDFHWKPFSPEDEFKFRCFPRVFVANFLSLRRAFLLGDARFSGVAEGLIVSRRVEGFSGCMTRIL